LCPGHYRVLRAKELSAKRQSEASPFPATEAMIPALAGSMAAMAAESADLFERMADLLPVGIFRTDATGRRVYVNQCWTRIAGLTFEQAKGDGWLNAIHPDDRARVVTEWERTVAERRSLRSEYRFRSS